MEFTMIETGWLSLLPPVIAIALALITKEVYSSLFLGLFSGMLIYSFAGGGTLIGAVATTFDMMYAKIADNARALLIPTLGATLAGSVYGDHCSPISDTTILASTGAACKHIRHVETQLPYATLVAAVCAVGYLIAGFTLSPWIALAVCAALVVGALLVLNRMSGKRPGPAR